MPHRKKKGRKISMKTELLNFIWDIISEEKIKKLDVKKIKYGHYDDTDYITQNGLCRAFLFHTQEDNFLCLAVVIENDISNQNIELSTYVTAVGKNSLPFKFQTYKEEIETMNHFIHGALKEIQIQIYNKPKTRLFFCTGYTLSIRNELEKQLKETKK